MFIILLRRQSRAGPSAPTLYPMGFPGGGSQDNSIFLGPVDLALGFRGAIRRPPGLLHFWFRDPMVTTSGDLGAGRREEETPGTHEALLKTPLLDWPMRPYWWLLLCVYYVCGLYVCVLCYMLLVAFITYCSSTLGLKMFVLEGGRTLSAVVVVIHIGRYLHFLRVLYRPIKNK